MLLQLNNSQLGVSAVTHTANGGSAYVGQDVDGCKHTLAMLLAINLHAIGQWLLQNYVL